MTGALIVLTGASLFIIGLGWYVSTHRPKARRSGTAKLERRQSDLNTISVD
jgi:hypothetical protein